MEKDKFGYGYSNSWIPQSYTEYEKKNPQEYTDIDSEFRESIRDDAESTWQRIRATDPETGGQFYDYMSEINEEADEQNWIRSPNGQLYWIGQGKRASMYPVEGVGDEPSTIKKGVGGLLGYLTDMFS